jgi:hypothetical protein
MKRWKVALLALFTIAFGHSTLVASDHFGSQQGYQRFGEPFSHSACTTELFLGCRERLSATRGAPTNATRPRARLSGPAFPPAPLAKARPLTRRRCELIRRKATGRLLLPPNSSGTAVDRPDGLERNGPAGVPGGIVAAAGPPWHGPRPAVPPSLPRLRLRAGRHIIANVT